MKTEFLQPQFEGSRFNEHTLPVEMARDLVAYETLIVELAKHLFLKDHPEKQRVPKGFAADFQLHIERVDEGSTRPLLTLISTSLLQFAPGNYFEKANDLITECISAPDDKLPKDFPRDLLSYFNQLGRSLREDERINFPDSKGHMATLTQERRKRLVLAVNKEYEKEIEITGTIEEVDWEKSTFRLRCTDGNRVTIPMPESFHATAREYGGRHRHAVVVKCIGTFDSWDRLQKVISVDTLEIQPDFQLVTRFDELRFLEDGWYDGSGIAPDKTQLEQIATKMVGIYPENLQLPAIIPTPEGNLLFEWSGTPGIPTVDIKLSDLTASFHSFDEKMGDIERDFDLANDDGWSLLFNFLTSRIERTTV